VDAAAVAGGEDARPVRARRTRCNHPLRLRQPAHVATGTAASASVSILSRTHQARTSEPDLDWSPALSRADPHGVPIPHLITGRTIWS